MPRRKTTDQIRGDIEEYTMNEFTLDGEYRTMTKKVSIKHHKCCSTFEITVPTFYNELKCKACGYQYDINKYFKIKNERQFKEKLKKLNPDLKVVGSYTDLFTRISVRHITCKHTQDYVPYKLLMNPICFRCHGGIELTNKDFLQKIGVTYNFTFLPLEEYKTHSKIKFLHTVCGKTFKSFTHSASAGSMGCPHCYKNNKMNSKKFQKQIDEITYKKKEFEVVGEYKDTDTKISIKHNVCGNTFKITPNAFMKTPKCGVCEKDMSLGEKKVSDILNDLNFIFKREYKFQDCKNKVALAFDFALFDKNNKLICLLEYDGVQHYFPVDSFGGIEAYEDGVLKDQIKNEYCKNNNIKLIRIPYWELDNLKKFLEKQFKKFEIHI